MAQDEIGEKKYVLRLSGEERAQLESMLSKGKHSAKTLVKARILLKADVSEAGEGMSDGEIIEQLEASVSMVYRVRKQLVEEGFDAVLTRKQHSRPAVPRIFDGEKEAKLSRCRARRRRKAMRAGPCGCWSEKWSSSPSSMLRATARSVVF